MLQAGHQLGAYRVISPLGAGGMGEVYLAEDSRLHRRVALKVLPAALAADDVSRKRLLREAQAAATLDHPNICTVYDVGDADGHSFIAMQYVEGETLAARLKRKPLDLKTALSVVSQVAAALAEAHRQGIIHRDIKPHNVMLTSGTQVKVLDFGLAKLTLPADSGATTATVLTEANVVAGTVPYMSPEQVRGEPLDSRTDVFSLGSLLYEIIGRVHPFASGSTADTMSAILTREPPPLPDPSIPAELQRILRKCLDKDRERRYQTMRDLAIDLENVAREITGPSARPSDPKVPPSPVATAPRRRSWRATALVAFGLLLAAAVGTFFYLRNAPTGQISAGDFVQITNVPDAASAPVLSRDGRMVAFIRGGWFLDPGEIYVKLLPKGDAVQLTNDSRRKYAPAFTPDGSRVTYTAVTDPGTPSMSWDTWSVPVLGGQPTLVLPNAAGLSWIDDRRVLFSEIEPGTGLHMGVVTASEDRAAERRVYFPAHERAMAHLSFLSPDHKWVLVVQMAGTGDFEQCQLVPFDGGSPARPVGPQGVCKAAAWSPDGRWMYFTVGVSGTSHLWRQRFPNGSIEQLTSGSATGEEGIAMAPDGGSLITSVGQTQDSLWVRQGGDPRLVPLEGSVSQVRVSVDGKRAYCLIRQSTQSLALGVSQVELASGKTDRMLTEFPMLDFDVSSDERRLAFTTVSDRGERQIWVAALDRRSAPREVVRDGDRAKFGKDGELVYRSLSGSVNHLSRIDATGQNQQTVWEHRVIDLGAVSPDGEWALIRTTRADRPSVITTTAVPLHGGEPKSLCNDLCTAEWSLDGRILYVGLHSGLGFPGEAHMLAMRLAPGHVFPDLPPGAMLDTLNWDRIAGVQVFDRDAVIAGPDPAVLMYLRSDQLRNLFRLQVL